MPVGEKTGTRGDTLVTLAASALAYTLRQLPDGRAAIMSGITAGSSGDSRSFTDNGKYVLPKDPTFAGLSGGRAYLDYSAGVVSFRKVGDRDYYLGRFVGDSAEADATCTVDLNCKGEFDYDLDLVRDPYATAPVGTQALGGFLPPARNGGALHLLLSATNEAQKADALSIDSFSKSARAIVEIRFRVPNDGATGAQDASLGIASATHATDADSIPIHLLVHLDGNVTAIKLQSKDGTTTVAATDTTKTYTEGSALANRVEVWFDLRDPTNVKCYVNGVRVLTGSTFKLDGAASELKLLAHLEKTASADVYEIAIDRLCARFQE
jgi:predicted RecA/RadA family phage recombinase